MFCDETYNIITHEEYQQLINDFLAIKKQKLRETPLIMCTWCADNVPETVDNCEQCAVYYLKQHLIETEEQ